VSFCCPFSETSTGAEFACVADGVSASRSVELTTVAATELLPTIRRARLPSRTKPVPATEMLVPPARGPRDGDSTAPATV
jgi:hypothetical protein